MNYTAPVTSTGSDGMLLYTNLPIWAHGAFSFSSKIIVKLTEIDLNWISIQQKHDF